MKINIRILSFIILCSHYCFSQQLINDSLYKYQIKSCRITYRAKDSISLYTPRLTEVIFDNYGALYKAVLHQEYDTTKKVHYISSSRKIINRLLLATPLADYDIDLNTKTGEHFSPNELQINPSYTGGKIIGTDTILGKICQIVRVSEHRDVWLWKNIALKEFFTYTGDYIVATSINENYIIKPNEFIVPKDIKIK